MTDKPKAWISTNDKFPEEGKDVLTFCRSDGYLVDYIVFSPENKPTHIWARVSPNDWDGEKYWMPLPLIREDM